MQITEQTQERINRVLPKWAQSLISNLQTELAKTPTQRNIEQANDLFMKIKKQCPDLDPIRWASGINNVAEKIAKK